MNTPKMWLKITIETSPLLVETITDYLVGVHEAGVEVVAADITEEPTGVVHCFIERADLSEADAEILAQQIASFAGEMTDIFQVEKPKCSWEFFEEEDWSRTWKEHFTPFSIVDGLVIAPTWEEYTAKEGEQVIVMDPGMAFGTGHHATTSLSLKYIQDVVAAGKAKTVLDVGCGTGILAMGAVLFGAEKAYGVDNDPEAVRAATENVARNGQSDRLEIAITDVRDLEGEYDLVVANIIHDVLAFLSEGLAARTKANGYLVLSGVLAADQADSITAIFAKLGFTRIDIASKDEWAAVLLQKTAA